MTTRYDAVVPAGGAARRLGGTDKPALTVGGRQLLDRVLAACAAAGETVVVGPRRPTARPVRWAREEPPGGGPVPALAAGLAVLAEPPPPAAPGPSGSGGRDATGGPDRAGAQVPAGEPDGRAAEVVVVLAADLPFLTAETVGALADAAAGAGREVDGVLLTDATGRDQPLAAAYRVEPLRRELALLVGEYGGLGGLPLRLLTGGLTLRRMADPTGEASFDCDTWEDVAAARARLERRSGG
ncbi:putative molybdopterin-guanine dinucleotide biosynthesis protein [Actinacidiphila reveromycinica]|uniref:Putative molybdopterin-guanine dinucleotide biosynthesis protein n=1 Tax=Actinacidiphila reveromycinica TaxID=659352 RepID=A0A7U3VPM9_9ACTN|nr:putative molybdopterin-guanine dinucleotide biosynthesis protein [Streptomyces sp. SN-593]